MATIYKLKMIKESKVKLMSKYLRLKHTGWHTRGFDFLKNLNLIVEISETTSPDFAFVQNAEKIFISFRFDIRTYKSWIIITGRTYDNNGDILTSDELLIETPEIPLVGGCWSNHVALRMCLGQNLVSTMLDSVYLCIKHDTSSFYGDNRKIEVIKVDRCLYAPLMYKLNPKNEKEYMDVLKERYPQAYEYAIKYPIFSEYLSEYHDKDVEEKL